MDCQMAVRTQDEELDYDWTRLCDMRCWRNPSLHAVAAMIHFDIDAGQEESETRLLFVNQDAIQ